MSINVPDTNDMMQVLQGIWHHERTVLAVKRIMIFTPIGSQKANKVKAYRLRQPLDKLQEIRLVKYANAAFIR